MQSKITRMSGLHFDNIWFSYGNTAVLHGVTITAHIGAITCLLGPSGCGKTTLLKLASGLLPMQRGAIHLNAAPLATPQRCPPPEKRPVGVVFQEGALFPHLTVENNIGFGIRDKSTAARRSAELIEQVGLSGLEHRYPHMLSGGQQQRVALARALAPQPQVLLLDEPFANIDIALRKTLRQQTRALLKSRNRVVILVTHDPDEALEMADEIAVLEAGSLVQSGNPVALYQTPKALSVATLLGEAQHLDAVITSSHIETPFGSWPLSSLMEPYRAIRGPADLAVRPSDITVVAGNSAIVQDCKTLPRGVQLLLASHGTAQARLTVATNMLHDVGNTVDCQPNTASLMAFKKSQ